MKQLHDCTIAHVLLICFSKATPIILALTMPIFIKNYWSDHALTNQSAPVRTAVLTIKEEGG